MDLKYCASEISNIALSMFRKNFFGVFHGSISARILHDSLITTEKGNVWPLEDINIKNLKKWGFYPCPV